MLVRCIAVVVALSAFAPSTADARHHRIGNRCCSRPAKCESAQEAKACEAYVETSEMSGGGGGYNAFAGPNGVYGVNTFTGQVYKFNQSTGEFEKLGKAIE